MVRLVPQNRNPYSSWNNDIICSVVSHYWPTCLSVRAETDKGRDAVNARGAGTARRCSAVVDVFRAVWSTPAINANTDIAADEVAASTSILASVWLQATLIYIFCTMLTCGEAGRWTRRGQNETN